MRSRCSRNVRYSVHDIYICFDLLIERGYHDFVDFSGAATIDTQDLRTHNQHRYNISSHDKEGTDVLAFILCTYHRRFISGHLLSLKNYNY